MSETKQESRERWRQHPKWAVEVSTLGRVRAFWSNETRIKKLSQKRCEGKTPLFYNVTSTPKGSVQRVSRLVLETFSGSCPIGKECRHLNGNSLDDRIENLSWGTRAEQISDQKAHGTFSPPPMSLGKNNPAFKHSEAAYKKALRLIAKGNSVRSIATLVGISKSQLLRRRRAVEEVENAKT